MKNQTVSKKAKSEHFILYLKNHDSLKNICKPSTGLSFKVKHALSKSIGALGDAHLKNLEHYLTFVPHKTHAKKDNEKDRRSTHFSPSFVENMLSDINFKQVLPKDLTFIDHQSQEEKNYVIRCICNSPEEEFGDMVQCDSCLCWLHIDCLRLGEKELEKSFYCPPCCKSKTSVFSEPTHDFEEIYDLSEELSDEESLPPSPSLSASDHDLVSSDLAGLQTPRLILDTCHSPSQETQTHDILSPFATNVFFGEHNTHGQLYPPLGSSPMHLKNDGPPSTVCYQELSKFSFENSPFFKSHRL
ncbi:hypothetical protein BY458DRAFT_506309 [Sporodiniella umbellata]|nr:hypothetical protein BY458DRAFT_506309 [Sporodiniella umbellata]